jgi:hypothetical protein
MVSCLKNRILPALAAVCAFVSAASAETLYNGITLSSPWPPRDVSVAEMSAHKPIPVPPYLRSPPSVVPIDVGRQLFVDDFLVGSSSLKRVHHVPDLYEKNHVYGNMVFSGGVFYDPQEKLFKIWSHGSGTSYATSRDGIKWVGAHVVLPVKTDSQTAWMDLDDKDPKRRYKLIRSVAGGDECVGVLYFSENGTDWGSPVRRTPTWGDRSTIFYNPFRKVWVFSIRSSGGGRARRYFECKDMAKDPLWGADGGKANGTAVPWAYSDSLDVPRADNKTVSQLYNLDCAGYESIMIGLFTVWRGYAEGRRDKINQVYIGYSRDGFHFTRPDRRPFCPISTAIADWNGANVQSAGGGCIVVGDKLYFYFSGRGRSWETGLGILRRDGFTSMDADASEGALTTRSVSFKGKYLFVNVDVPDGELRCEVVGGGPAYSKENCVPITGDTTIQRVTWKGADDLAPMSGKPVQIKFYLKKGSLYSFWVSPDESGASYGYIAGGGPGYTSHVDTVGMAAKAKPEPEGPYVASLPAVIPSLFPEEEAPLAGAEPVKIESESPLSPEVKPKTETPEE